MNERLKELMLEVGYAAPEIANRAQVLAESIVRECVKIADNHYDTKSAIHDIKEHFGVE